MVLPKDAVMATKVDASERMTWGRTKYMRDRGPAVTLDEYLMSPSTAPVVMDHTLTVLFACWVAITVLVGDISIWWMATPLLALSERPSAGTISICLAARRAKRLSVGPMLDGARAGSTVDEELEDTESLNATELAPSEPWNDFRFVLKTPGSLSLSVVFLAVAEFETEPELRVVGGLGDGGLISSKVGSS